MFSLRKLSGFVSVVTALLFIGFIIMFALLKYEPQEDEALGFALFFIIFGGYGMIIVYASQIPFILVTLIIGIKLLRADDGDKIVSLNKKLLIACIVLALFVGVGLYYVGILFFGLHAISLFSGIYVVVAAAAYLACIVTSVVSMIFARR